MWSRKHHSWADRARCAHLYDVSIANYLHALVCIYFMLLILDLHMNTFRHREVKNPQRFRNNLPCQRRSRMRYFCCTTSYYASWVWSWDSATLQRCLKWQQVRTSLFLFEPFAIPVTFYSSKFGWAKTMCHFFFCQLDASVSPCCSPGCCYTTCRSSTNFLIPFLSLYARFVLHADAHATNAHIRTALWSLFVLLWQSRLRTIHIVHHLITPFMIHGGMMANHTVSGSQINGWSHSSKKPIIQSVMKIQKPSSEYMS